MHKKADLAALGYRAARTCTCWRRPFRGAVGDRIVWIGDPAYHRADLAALASPQRMAARRALISMTSTRTAERFVLDEAGTSHFVAVDEQGNVVSLTSTVNNMFGSKLVTKGGFVLNDRARRLHHHGDREALASTRAARPNAPQGGARPTSSMTPTVVLKDGEPVFAAGGSGRLRITTATTQVLLARLVFDRAAARRWPIRGSIRRRRAGCSSIRRRRRPCWPIWRRAARSWRARSRTSARCRRCRSG